MVCDLETTWRYFRDAYERGCFAPQGRLEVPDLVRKSPQGRLHPGLALRRLLGRKHVTKLVEGLVGEAFGGTLFLTDLCCLCYTIF